MANILYSNNQDNMFTEEMYGSSTCEQPWKLISEIVGWTYLVAWSASFFPQAVENY
jgi:hypothetical protein